MPRQDETRRPAIGTGSPAQRQLASHVHPGSGHRQPVARSLLLAQEYGVAHTCDRMGQRGRDILVIGTSAGGLEVLDQLVAQLPTDLPAAIFIVQHMSPESSGDALVGRLGKHRSFQCKLADDHEPFHPARIYIARPDHHLLLKKRTTIVTKGARENRYRPAIDSLFRSAAVSHGPRVIGVVLTGMLDDGTAGLIAIKSCGGVTVAQDPADAAYPEMPWSALTNAGVDHCVPLGAMGVLLEGLVNGRPGRTVAIPEHVRTEAEIAERVLSNVAQVEVLGTQVPYNCPNCGGVLWKVDKERMQRYRCHTGHSFTDAALLASQSERIEETLWTALRMFEERKNLLGGMAGRRRGKGPNPYLQRAEDTEVHIERVRAMLQAAQSASSREGPVTKPSPRPRKRGKRTSVTRPGAGRRVRSPASPRT
jgi:two-component system chemotaxis response regulator CheB